MFESRAASVRFADVMKATSSSTTTAFRLDVGAGDLGRELRHVLVTDALSEAALDIVVDDLREAVQLLLDGLGLLDEDLEDAMLGPLRQDEERTAAKRGAGSNPFFARSAQPSTSKIRRSIT